MLGIEGMVGGKLVVLNRGSLGGWEEFSIGFTFCDQLLFGKVPFEGNSFGLVESA